MLQSGHIHPFLPHPLTHGVKAISSWKRSRRRTLRVRTDWETSAVASKGRPIHFSPKKNRTKVRRCQYVSVAGDNSFRRRRAVWFAFIYNIIRTLYKRYILYLRSSTSQLDLPRSAAEFEIFLNSFIRYDIRYIHKIYIFCACLYRRNGGENAYQTGQIVRFIANLLIFLNSISDFEKLYERALNYVGKYCGL